MCNVKYGVTIQGDIKYGAKIFFPIRKNKHRADQDEEKKRQGARKHNIHMIMSDDQG